ncbi:hypothetical protein BDU57DRAFT_537666 [Ampelomyces quisqualis]|uniref:Sds3-like-domain-containing protein n=1 Tax=Ampelomyces quisqualis TaxID=50730 RepID=A0A6A5QT98_AMPQU|nr:hypothetical protein BDU57DRAFT_537666 [Ampelomyces quisqualis]
MPTKRKNKATKAASVLPSKTPPRNKVSEDTKPGQVRRNSLAPTSRKTSRLLPSIPFQMMTRRGAKTTSAGPSSASSGSRRSSLNDVAQFQEAPSDCDEPPAAKRRRTSNGSSNNTSPMNESAQKIDLQKPATTSTASKTAGKKRRASDNSTQSSKTLESRPIGVLGRTQSDVSEQQPRRKKRKTAQGPADSGDQPPELTDASTAPNSPEQLPDVDGSQSLQNVLPTNGDAPAKPGRRLPGRRRQPHPDVNIEADLRRQLTLKMNYRSLAKVQKTLLEELSKRTVTNLEKSQNYHEQCPEYEPLMVQLKQRRDGRVDQTDAARTYRLEQLQRVRIAEERIQKEQYINRFQDLQDDFLLQCYYQMKRLERELKGEEADATDDEENILPPTFTDEPHHEFEDRIGSKYASRSRAYIEADRELEDDARRKRFHLARAAFVAKDEDADDAIESATGGFAKFAGPDRDEAIAHHNLNSIVDAALEIERTPTPQVEVPENSVVSNDQAVDLMMLAELSERHAQETIAPNAPEPQQQSQHEEPEPQRVATPPRIQELPRQMSPVNATPSIPLPSQAAHGNPVKASPAAAPQTRESVHSEPNGIPEATRDIVPARVSTHRIMDMLNNDQDVPVFRSKDVQPAKISQPLAQEPSTPSKRTATVSQQNTPFYEPDDAPPILGDDDSEEPVDQALMDALGGRPSEPPRSPPRNQQPWPIPNAAPAREPEEAPRRKDPLQKIRELLDRKAREHGREPPDRSRYRFGEGPNGPILPLLPSIQAAHQERSNVAGYDPTHPSAGLYPASSSAAPSHHPAERRESQDRGSSHWDRDRRISGQQSSHQPSQSPYSNSSQPHQVEHHRTASNPSSHQSSYSLPSGSLPLPPKPPGPPPPVNFRFAHYDPAPPRPAYPPQSPTYPPGSHAPPMGLQSPHYPPSYQTSYPGYVPPAGSFQAPPPPPTLAPYPPLKIHQYGGQPILPASMAPPPHAGPHMGFHGQQQTLPPQPAYSPPQTQPRPQYEPLREDQSRERPPEPQSRPRRQYRSYHAPGTQFRSYQGPGEHRRRGS